MKYSNLHHVFITRNQQLINHKHVESFNSKNFWNGSCYVQVSDTQVRTQKNLVGFLGTLT